MARKKSELVGDYLTVKMPERFKAIANGENVLTDQQLNCFRGLHESEQSERVELTVTRFRQECGQITSSGRYVFTCKHCRCLYVQQ